MTKKPDKKPAPAECDICGEKPVLPSTGLCHSCTYGTKKEKTK